MATTIGECCQVFAGSSAPQDKTVFVSEGIPFVRAGSLEHLCSGGSLDDCEQINKEIGTKLKLRLAPAETILFAKSGMSAMKDRVYCLPREAYVVSHLAGLIPSKSVDSRYLAYWFHVNPPSRLINDPAYPSIRLSEISKVKFNPPSLNEQKRIAAILDKADEIEKFSIQINDLEKNLIQSIFLEMFGDPIRNPLAWNTTNIEDTGSLIQIGPFGSLLHKSDFGFGGIPIVNPKHIIDGEIKTNDNETISAVKAGELTKYQLKLGDLVIGRRGEMGRCAIVTKEYHDCLCGTGSLFIRPNPEHFNVEFLAHLFSSESMKKHLEKIAWGATMPNLNKEKISSLKIPIPPILLQKKFATVITELSKFFGSASKKKDSTSVLSASLKQSMLSKLN